MKKIINLFLIAALVFVYSCNKQENVAYYTGGTAPVLTGTANSGTSIKLNATDSTLNAITLAWTNPNYTFNYGISSLTVGYLVEIDTTGSNFTNPKRAQVSVNQLNNLSLTEGAINSYLANQMGLDTSFSHKLDIRVSASMTTSGNGAATVYSNVLNYTAKPFYPPPLVAPPSSYSDNSAGTLYIVGSAVNGGWGNPIAAANIASQKFTKVSTTQYKITMPIIGDGEYKLIGVNDGSWNDQWSIKTEQSSGDASTLSYSLFYNGANARAPLQSGTYLIAVDFQHGLVTFTKQ